MKKIFYVALAATMAAFSASTFTSCKDTDDITNMQLKHDKDVAKLQGEINGLLDEIQALKNVDAETKKQLEEKAKELQDKIDALEASSATKEELAAEKLALETAINTFKEEVKSILKGLVTGIRINEVKNSAFGSFNGFFTNMQSTILVGYYGVNESGAEIPALEDVKLGEINFSINPADVILASDQKFTLINSVGDAGHGIVLSDAVEAKEAIHSGITRADAVYSYVTTATIPLKDAKETIRLDLDKTKLKAELKKLQEANAVRPALSSIANIITDIINALSVDRLAMKSNFSYTFDGETVNNTQVTAFDMKAITVKPLGLNGYEFKGVPGYGIVRNAAKKVMDAVIEKVQTTIYNKYQGSELKAKLDEFKASLEDVKELKIVNTVDGDKVLEVRNKNGVLLGYITMDALNRIYEDINAGLGNYNKVFSSASEMVDAINKLFEQIKTSTALTSMENSLLAKLDKYNEKIGAKLNNLFEPVLLIQTEKGLSRAGFPGVPSVVTGEVTLIPTTYSAELLTPLYRKILTVNDEEVLNVTQELGATVTITEPGEYTIVYEGKDYSGHTIDADTHTYKIIVK